MINYLLRANYIPDMGSGKLYAEHGDVFPHTLFSLSWSLSPRDFHSCFLLRKEWNWEGLVRVYEHQYPWDAQIYSVTLEGQALLLAPPGISVLL